MNVIKSAFDKDILVGYYQNPRGEYGEQEKSHYLQEITHITHIEAI